MRYTLDGGCGCGSEEGWMRWENSSELFLCFQQVAINEPHGAAHASAKSTAFNLIDENVPALSSRLQRQ